MDVLYVKPQNVFLKLAWVAVDSVTLLLRPGFLTCLCPVQVWLVFEVSAHVSGPCIGGDLDSPI
jgi:hypothetical protein